MNEKYITMHGLDFDIQYSNCRDCKFDECQYYYNNCPYEDGEGD